MVPSSKTSVAAALFSSSPSPGSCPLQRLAITDLWCKQCQQSFRQKIWYILLKDKHSIPSAKWNRKSLRRVLISICPPDSFTPFRSKADHHHLSEQHQVDTENEHNFCIYTSMYRSTAIRHRPIPVFETNPSGDHISHQVALTFPFHKLLPWKRLFLSIKSTFPPDVTTVVAQSLHDLESSTREGPP